MWTGQTASNDFFTSVGAFQTTYGGGTSDAFVSKFDVNGTSLYSTYLGGTGADTGNAITVNSSGTDDIAGATDSTSFPINGFGRFSIQQRWRHRCILTRFSTLRRPVLARCFIQLISAAPAMIRALAIVDRQRRLQLSHRHHDFDRFAIR